MSIKKLRNEILSLPTLPNIKPIDDAAFTSKTSAQKHLYLYNLLKKVVRRQRKQGNLIEELTDMVLEMKSKMNRKGM